MSGYLLLDEGGGGGGGGRDHLKGAFCIPTRPQRVWWPAAGAVDDDELDRYIHETLGRNYNFAQILVSGLPYAGEYPEIPLSLGRLDRVLSRCKDAGLITVVAFDDTRWPSLGYLRPVLTPLRKLVDWCMGIYEVNGVTKSAETVLDILVQSRDLLPDSLLAVHFTPLDEGEESYGLVDFHAAQAQAGLNCLFFQTAGWRVGVEAATWRFQDFTRRLGNGMHGAPILSHGVCDYENTTSLTFRYQMSEADAVAFTDAMMNAPLEPDGEPPVYAVPAMGFGDGGTP